jgi:Amidohydrolase family
MNNVKLLCDAGVLVVFGTDSGATPTRLTGWAEHRELQLLVEAGLSPMEAIRCATRNAADVLGDLKNRGTLEPGKGAGFPHTRCGSARRHSKYHAARGGLSCRQARRAQVSRRIHTKYIARAMNPHLCRTWVPRHDWCDGRPRTGAGGGAAGTAGVAHGRTSTLAPKWFAGCVSATFAVSARSRASRKSNAVIGHASAATPVPWSVSAPGATRRTRRYVVRVCDRRHFARAPTR